VKPPTWSETEQVARRPAAKLPRVLPGPLVVLAARGLAVRAADLYRPASRAGATTDDSDLWYGRVTELMNERNRAAALAADDQE
jgi:hypothetical protein